MNKIYSELLAQKKEIEDQLSEVKKSERTAALKMVKELCEEFQFTAKMLGPSLAKGRRRLKP
ncbi:H-NS histone family protein [Litorivicinus sp.]|jgi:hypothetical protein|nr:H-NS histone family protein [Litorivicinus sp.]MDB9862757.1 H-NS histone family protein [Litorivicinus sp.]MDC1208577.1 H-NS histone family protein [Litorivicinus sp.]MDC1239825.1 H-NS histone family protein [Litorivicinus sp.]|tara:strand:+ start:223 stop:408 length:186 start_codon:yes stop_codon:yes gene_type:complete